MQNPTDPMTTFIRDTIQSAKKSEIVIAVSGGIDSAVSLTLATLALGPEHVHPIFLPYHDQSVVDSETICNWNHIPSTNITIQNIGPVTDALSQQLAIPKTDRLRRGNIMARVRMIVVYDRAKSLNALVCGTENKSEHYLGYFTRFGDEASDIEPLRQVYKTQVRQLARTLHIPETIITKSPSAGLWTGQTDEDELGFSYVQADQIIAEYLSEKAVDPTIPDSVRTLVLERIHASHFKHEVPYLMQ